MADLGGIEQHGHHDVGAREHREVDHRLLAHGGYGLLPQGIGHLVIQGQLHAVVVDQPLIAGHGGGAAALPQIGHHGIRQPRPPRDGLVRPPFVLRVGNACLDQDRELVQALGNGGLEAQVIEQFEAPPRHVRAAQQGVVRPAEGSAGDLEDVVGERPDFGREVGVSDLAEAFGHGRILGGRPARNDEWIPRFELEREKTPSW